MSPLVFCDPPRRGSVDQYDWRDVALELVEHPRTWARLDVFDNGSSAATLVSNIKRGRTPLDSELFETCSAKFLDGGEQRWGAWVRFVGEEPAADG